MDYQAISTAISSLGFPIAMCIAMFWYVSKQDTQHKEAIEKWQEAFNNNTRILEKLYERLGGNLNE